MTLRRVDDSFLGRKAKLPLHGKMKSDEKDQIAGIKERKTDILFLQRLSRSGSMFQMQQSRLSWMLIAFDLVNFINLEVVSVGGAVPRSSSGQSKTDLGAPHAYHDRNDQWICPCGGREPKMRGSGDLEPDNQTTRISWRYHRRFSDFVARLRKAAKPH